MLLDLAGEPVRLLAERVILWRRTLLVADVHLGKSDTFRHFGLPLPDGDLDVDLTRLARLTETLAVERVLVLGDLVHAANGLNEEVVQRVAAWRSVLNADLELVPGNHDQFDPPASWHVRVRPDGHTEGPFRFVHKPGTLAGSYTWCGHVHPAVVVGRGRLAERFACFWLAAELGMLPAFGSFTGGFSVRPAPGDQVVAITSEGLIALPVTR